MLDADDAEHLANPPSFLARSEESS